MTHNADHYLRECGFRHRLDEFAFMDFDRVWGGLPAPCPGVCRAVSRQGNVCARPVGHIGCHEVYVDGDGRRWWGSITDPIAMAA